MPPGTREVTSVQAADGMVFVRGENTEMPHQALALETGPDARLDPELCL
jgi:hypothetical protein